MAKTTKDNKEMSVEEAKKQALKLTLEKLDKTYGKGTVRALGDNPVEDGEVYSTGSIGLDAALGVGGYPKGRVIEIYGPESSGKTTLTLHAIAEVQKAKGTAAFIDAEHAFDPVYAQRLGVDVKNLLITQPDSGEQALEIADALIRSNAVDLHARLMSQALRKITGSISKAKCIVIFINQLRDKIGITFGNPETTTGGNALKFYASVRIDIRKDGGPQGSAAIKDSNGEIIGNKTKVKIVKNKVASPFKTATFDIMFGLGISKSAELLELGVEADIVDKSGAFYSYKGTRLGQGRDASIAMLNDNPEIAEQIEVELREWLKHNELSSNPKKGKKSTKAKDKKAVEPEYSEEEYDEADNYDEEDD